MRVLDVVQDVAVDVVEDLEIHLVVLTLVTCLVIPHHNLVVPHHMTPTTKKNGQDFMNVIQLKQQLVVSLKHITTHTCKRILTILTAN